MAIITISRGSYSKGKEVAQRVAQTLGYECISREILLEASEHFNISEIKLVRALHDAPSILERFTYGKERYLAYVAAALLKRVQKNNVVYHGLAGHFFLTGVSHVLKVRILANLDDRVALEMEREGLDREQTLARLLKDDEERRKWSQHLFGKDPWDPNLYDLVLHVHKLNLDDTVNIICQTAGLPQFQATPESQQVLDDLVLAAEVRADLVQDFPMVQVHAEKGVVIVDAKINQEVEPELADRIKERALRTPGAKEVRMHACQVTPIGCSGR
ncbi:MAG: cytidylate kinase-like family protein [Deltaproteobacteria bacterium]|nr:cytidylate kinase-like family protein [Deltaproteobacteria bacterium]